MAAHAKSHKELTDAGQWRADRHAGLVDAQGVAPLEDDSKIWNLIAHWQEMLDLAKAEIAADGIVIENAGGQYQPHPAHKVQKEASAELRALFALVGVGPLNRSRLGKGGDAADDLADDGLPPRLVNHG